jgi:hypothetical protein
MPRPRRLHRDAVVVQYQDAQFAGAFGGVVVTLLDRDDRTCHEYMPLASENVRVLDPGRLGEPAQKVANVRQVGHASG